MKKTYQWLLAFAFIAAFATFIAVYYANHKDFREEVTEVGQKILPEGANVTVKYDVLVKHYEELKKPYLDALTTCYEAMLFELVPNEDYYEAYVSLQIADGEPDHQYRRYFNELSQIGDMHNGHKLRAVMGDMVYEGFLSARKRLMEEQVKKLDKSSKCIVAEAKTLARKIRRGEFNEPLYQKYLVEVDIPVNSNLSYLGSFYLNDYYTDPEVGLLIAEQQFKEQMVKSKEFAKEYSTCN